MAKFELPELPYSYDSLEPYIDKLTMEIHHSRHHNTYTTKLNEAVVGTEHEGKSLEDLFSQVSKLPAAIRNSGGGHYNHCLFWSVMTGSTTAPSGLLAEDINNSFGSLEQLKNLFSTAAVNRFGSGWAWLVLADGKLVVTSTPNQDNPLMDLADVKGTPLLTLDVWEHAYYLKYQNKRPDYIQNWWSVVNWDKVGELYLAAK